MVPEQLAFFENYPTGIYRRTFLCTLDRGQLYEEDKGRFQADLEKLSSNPELGYIPTPKKFLQRWLDGRRSGEPKLNEYYHSLGFELQIPVVKTINFDGGVVVNSIEGLVLASDFGYSSDFEGTLVFAINDILTERALVYRDEDERLKLEPFAKKNLKSQRIYGFPDSPQEYPFCSLNPLKSLNYTWSLINISPEEVYQALREIGFEW